MLSSEGLVPESAWLCPLAHARVLIRFRAVYAAGEAGVTTGTEGLTKRLLRGAAETRPRERHTAVGSSVSGTSGNPLRVVERERAYDGSTQVKLLSCHGQGSLRAFHRRLSLPFVPAQ